MPPEIADAVEALLEQRQDQGFDTPPETVAAALARLIVEAVKKREVDGGR